MLFTFSPDAYDAAQAPPFFDEAGDFVVVGAGNLFNGIRVAGKDSPHGRAIYAADKNNVQPRIGAAWDPRGEGRLVVRAGYGVYFDQTQVGIHFARICSSATRRSRIPGAAQSSSPWQFLHLMRLQRATRSWRLDGSSGTPACNDACILAA